MIGCRLRSARVGLVAVLVATSVLAGAVLRPAAAGGSSASGILANAWIITDLGGDALSTQAELSPYERGLATTATTGTVATSGLSKVPKAGALGMVLNTVGVLGGLAFAFGGGDDEPALPMPPPSDTATGSEGCAWTTVAGATVSGCTSSTTITIAMPSAPSNGRWGFKNPRIGGGYSLCSSGASTCTIGRPPSNGTDGTVYDWPRIVNMASGWSTAQADAAPSVGSLWTVRFGGTYANPAPGTSTDPATVPRYIDSTATCASATGGAPTILTERTGPFYITPGAPWSTPEVPDLTCPAGSFLESGTRTLNTPSAGAGTDVQLQEPYTAPPWVADQVTRFPDCYPATAVRCTLEVVRTVPAPEVACGSYSIGSANPCADWWTDPQRSTRYECRFGGTTVAMKRCAPYADTFSVGTVAPTDPNPDEEVTDPTPGTDPTPEATPDLGGCVPNWSMELLNPWWVFKAQACALMWVFVPQTSLETRVSAIKADLEYRVPFVWFDGFLTIPAAVPGGGCPDWRVKIPNPGGEGYQLDKNVVCDSSYTDALRTARPVLLVFMASLAFWPMIRSIGYASFPIIKPIPGGGR